ncbi:MAG: trypsin-like peptidase domain-containing protein [Eubacteriales bacterium]
MEEKRYVEFEFESLDEEPKVAPAQPAMKYRRKKRHNGANVVAMMLCCAMVGGISGGAAVYFTMPRTVTETVVTETIQQPLLETVPTVAPVASTVTLAGSSDGLTPVDVYEQNVGAVVGISTSGVSTNVFGQSVEYASSGTGFVVTSDGYIVTNNHVVNGATSVEVTLHDGTTYEATVVGTETINTDIALLKVEATGLQTVSIGNSDNLAVGDQVAAIGNPLGELTFSQTVGYVSAVDRELNTDGTPMNMMQIDVAINSGNSGGPLFDMEGNVVGVTTAKYSGSSGTGASIEGIGFALPINDVVDIVNDLKEYGYVTGKAYLGVSIQELDSQTARYYSLPQGVYIAVVEEGSCAETAGVEMGDVVIALGDVETPDYATLATVLNNTDAGTASTITVYRSGEELVLPITFDEKLPVE